MTTPDTRHGVGRDPRLRGRESEAFINIIEDQMPQILEDLYIISPLFYLGRCPHDLVNMDVIWTPRGTG